MICRHSLRTNQEDPAVQAHRDDTEDSSCFRVTQENVDEADHLQRLSQAHGVGQDATEARVGLVVGQVLDQVVKHEANPPDLQRIDEVTAKQPSSAALKRNDC